VHIEILDCTKEKEKIVLLSDIRHVF